LGNPLVEPVRGMHATAQPEEIQFARPDLAELLAS
jgi:hypothetical protein